MKQYELWDDIPNGVTVYVPEHNLLAIKLENAKLVAITEHGGRSGWIQTTGRLRGPFEDVYGKLLPLKVIEPPKPEPRQWRVLGEVPWSVAQVRDNVGDRWKRKGGRWHYRSEYKENGSWWAEWDDKRDDPLFGPFTEIVK